MIILSIMKKKVLSIRLWHTIIYKMSLSSEQHICENKMWILEMIFAKPISKSYMQWNKAASDHRQRSTASQNGVIRHLPSGPPGQNTAVGSLSLLQGIFPTQGSNPGLLHCRWILYHLSHQGSPKVSCRGAKVVFNPLATVSVTFIHFIIKDAENREFK